MTDTEEQVELAVQATAEAEAHTPEPDVASHCRWCGGPREGAAESENWLCDNCQRYQDATTCPTCNQLTRVSALPIDMVPEPHAPAKQRKGKE